MNVDLSSVSRHSTRQKALRLLLLAAFGVVLGLVVTQLLGPRGRGGVGDAGFHSAIELLGSVLGLLAGLAFLCRFWVLGNRFYLLLGMAFVVGGCKDLIHGAASWDRFSELTGWTFAQIDRLLFPANATGRVAMGLILLAAPFVQHRFGTATRAKRDTILACVGALALACLLTAVSNAVPASGWFYPSWIVPRPTNLIAAIVFAAASVAILRVYWKEGDGLIWWLLVSLECIGAGQVLMMSYGQMFGPAYDMGHLMKALGYGIPLFGFCLNQITIVSRLQQAGSALARSENDLRTLLEALPAGVVVVGQDKRVRWLNGMAMKMVGLPSRDSALGHVCQEVLGLAEPHRCPILDLGKDVDNCETTLLTKDRGKLPVLKRVIPVRLGDEDVVLEVLVDLSERVRAEDELRRYATALESANTTLGQAKIAAEAAAKAKSEFLANMSHEIRTPMTAILGYIDILLGNAPDAESTEALRTVKRNGDYLLTLINDILNLSKIEAGRLGIEKTAISPAAVVEEVLSLMRVRAQAKDLPLVVQYATPIPRTIHSDPVRLRQILVNLVGNAIKFTSTGGVRIEVRMAAEDPTRLQFRVIDTGIGMTPTQMADIFQPFTQVHSSPARRYGGTGLGLAISQRLAEMLGGTISVESEPSKGSTFALQIDPGPLEGVAMESEPTAGALHASKPAQDDTLAKTPIRSRILLAEDGPDNQRLIALLLRKAGAEVVVAENGQVACDAAIAARDADRPFGAILMDMQMPVMDGYEATRKLRVKGYTGPIIALTAHAMTEDRQRCLAAGCDEYLSKPVDRNLLVSTVNRFLQSHCSADSSVCA